MLTPIADSMRRARGLFVFAAALLAVASATDRTCAADEPLRARAAAALRKAVDYFLEEVSTEGGYLWRYSADLKLREGERPATDTMVWVQPPGTPTVGIALLDVYEKTGERHYLEAARRAAMALVRGQLRSGGWGYEIEFDPAKRGRYAYRVEAATSERQYNTSVLDDDTTQSALRLLMRVDRALDFQDEAIHEAALFGLDSLVAAQYPNGAWPQRYSQPPAAEQFPVKKAQYPESWSRTWPAENYSNYYTFNDNAMGDAVEVMVEASRTYDAPKYLEAATRCGDFMLLAQMPEPQPAWAQQYNHEMQPAWARKFEPPSITGGESQSVLESLLFLYARTGQQRFLAPVPGALSYLKSSLRPDGRMPRFLELKTNKPLYFTKDYVLTYSDADMPTHYAFITSSRLERLGREYERLRGLAGDKLPEQPGALRRPTRVSEEVVQRAETVLAALDDQGRWTTTGTLRSAGSDAEMRIVATTTFCANIQALAQYLWASRTE